MDIVGATDGFNFTWRFRKGISRGWCLFLLGGWGNTVERLIRGCVVDYWNLPVFGLKNNINDWLIFGGLILIIGEYLWEKKSK